MLARGLGSRKRSSFHGAKENKLPGRWVHLRGETSPRVVCDSFVADQPMKFRPDD